MTRNDDNDAIFRAANNAAGGAVAVGKIRLDKVSWFMPHVTPADKDKMELYKIIERKEKLPVGYRMIQCDSASIPQATSFSWRLSVKSSPEVPRFIIVVSVSNIYVMLNYIRYPTTDYNISFLAQNLVGCMVMLLNLDLSFLTWMSWYQAQTLTPQTIKASILYFYSTFPNKAKN